MTPDAPATFAAAGTGVRFAIRLRLLAWRAAVALTLAADVVFICTHRPTPAVLAAVGVTAIALLLATTPPDAIRLRVESSEAIITSAALLLGLLDLCVPPHHWSDPVEPFGLVLIVFAIQHRFPRSSPWWAAAVGWHPLVFLDRVQDANPVSLWAAAASAFVVFALAVRSAIRSGNASAP